MTGDHFLNHQKKNQYLVYEIVLCEAEFASPSSPPRRPYESHPHRDEQFSLTHGAQLQFQYVNTADVIGADSLPTSLHRPMK